MKNSYRTSRSASDVVAILEVVRVIGVRLTIKNLVHVCIISTAIGAVPRDVCNSPTQRPLKSGQPDNEKPPSLKRHPTRSNDTQISPETDPGPRTSIHHGTLNCKLRFNRKAARIPEPTIRYASVLR